MKKFAIEVTKGDVCTILKTFDDKESAMTAGVEFRKQYTREQGLLSCIEANFNENDQMIGSDFKLCYSWL